MSGIEKLPHIFHISVLGIDVWQLIAIAVLLIIGWICARLITPMIMRTLEKGARKTDTQWDDEMVEALSAPLRFGLSALFLFVTVPWLEFASPDQPGIRVVWKIAAVLILGAFVSSGVRVWGKMLERSNRGQTDEVIRSFVPIFVRAAKIAVWAIVLVVVLDASGVEIMGLVAGLGIGGFAVAFAAKETIANLFGSLAIASDRPFGVGDSIKIGDLSGTVEDVGLRSTRLRTAARTIVTIPNGSLMSMKIENISHRDRILFASTLNLSLETTTAQLRYIIKELKSSLLTNKKVYQDLLRVRLAGFGESAFNISIRTMFTTTDYNEYTMLVEDFNFEILRIVEDAGTHLALPAHTMYSAKASPINTARAEEIAAEINMHAEDA